MSIYHYDVDIVPKLSSKAVARCLKDELLRMYGADFQDKLLVYDGRKNLYCAGPLPFVSQEFKEVFSKENNKTYKMTIRLVNIMDMTDILEFLSGRKATAPNQHLQALDVALREASMSLYVPIGRSFFTKDLGHATLDGGLTAWNGFFQSLRLTAQGLAVNVDMVTTAFYESIPVIDYLRSKVPHFNPQNRLNVTDWTMMKDLEKLKIETVDPGDNSSPSIAALVANVDWPSATKYVATARAQSHREEMIENLQGMVQELWHKFCDKTKLRPERVVMFMDGVSEGQFEMVLQDELHAMKEAMVAVGGPNYMPKITWIVVQKRHHTRLFPGDQNKDKSNNVMPGTVVDSVITHPHEFDFYLCSHAGIQGTSKPTHYHVLWDENSFSSDDLQAFSYNLCHIYARCARSVFVVPPAYYAHHGAYRARLYIQGQRGSDSASYTRGQPSPLIRSLPLIKKNVEEFM
ncbi:hypothetical protein L7F22_052394 [Adiantum nelumboides]|nr:hypothetical protein [Adiantum nelumboides]